MSIYPAGSYRVDMHFVWATGETGDFTATVTHRGATQEEMAAAALELLTAERGDELPSSLYTCTVSIS